MAQGIILENREMWSDKEWASYLNCPVEKIAEYRKILNDNFVLGVEQNKETKKYSFVSYKWHIHPSGHRSSQLWLTDDLHRFDTFSQAAQYANQNIISKLQLTDFWAKQYNIPSKALQMMLIRTK